MAYLVGAGPGDPELLTLKAARCLAEAEVVLHDALVDGRILEHIAASARRIDVGKRCGNHTWTQETIGHRLCEEVRAGYRVVRLKSGDPFVFGRGGEEMLALAEAGLPYTIVPGVTAGIAVPAFAGVPVTHRGLSTGVTFITGHERDEHDTLDYATLARLGHTLCVFMVYRRIAVFAERLVAAGQNPHTPAMVIENGGRPDHRSVMGTLETLPQIAAAARFTGPTLLVVGEVVRLHESCRWFVPTASALEPSAFETSHSGANEPRVWAKG
jgi:uroporphyrin-III C-methyltransferase/precorrin-2 dehydrogenase/sirohydrochlorin ferrochelatase